MEEGLQYVSVSHCCALIGLGLGSGLPVVSGRVRWAASVVWSEGTCSPPIYETDFIHTLDGFDGD